MCSTSPSWIGTGAKWAGQTESFSPSAIASVNAFAVAAALGSRLHPALGRFVSAIERRLGLDAGRPVRVGFGDIETVEPKIRIRVAIGETAAEAVEQRLRSWVLKLPGSR